jgi:hypothetical protein
MPKHTSQTKWEEVQRMADSDAPIPYDSADGPYDPNDQAATEAYLSRCVITVGPGESTPVAAPGRLAQTHRR